MKWVEISAYPSTKRLQFLSDHLNAKGFENSLAFVDTTPAGFEDELTSAMQTYDIIRIGRGLGSVVMQYFKKNTADVRHLGAADTIVKVDGEWWLANVTFPALQRELSEIGTKLNISSEALIVGAGASARAAVGAIVKMGFKTVNISNQFDEQAQDLIGDVKRKYFDVKFNFVPKDQLILLPGTNGIVINTTPFSPENDVLNELYYFNFLQRPGVAMDLVLSPPETPLIKEALGIQATVVCGYQVASWADVLWADWYLDLKLDHTEYEELLKQALI
ncbi:MAG: hypothetical protein H6626_07300 [Pseudobdellovibrionaceae bacterium]|nr:MAG: hypothetical protein H6626_07300 [Pseudobdellovibrionaceae bacterium]